MLPFRVGLVGSLVLGSAAFSAERTKQGSPPHIVFLVADDLGWNDVSWHGSKQVQTPHIDKIAGEGVTLERYYVQQECSPSRASFLTGRHVAHTGIQAALAGAHSFDMYNRPYGLPLEYSTLPQLLKAHFGYWTVMVGKWHLGMRAPAYTPSKRGFDHFFGYYQGVMDYWGHFDDEAFGLWGASLHQDEQPVYDTTGTYSTSLFLSRARTYIEQYANATGRGTRGPPLFLYFALQSIHSANNKHLQAPQKDLDAFADIAPTFCGAYDVTFGLQKGCATPKARRRTVAAMVGAMDDAVGELRSALEWSGLWNHTLTVFTTDNGGPVDGYDANEASNWPLRGGKGNFFEGGVRAVGLVSGAGLGARAGSHFTGLMHAVDWVPTLLSAACAADTGGRPGVRCTSVPGGGGDGGGGTRFDLARALSDAGEPRLLPGDGVDVWAALSTEAEPPRSEVLLASQAAGSPLGHQALIRANYKLLIEDQFYPSFGYCEDMNQDVLSPRCAWYAPPGDDVSQHREHTTVRCPPPPPPTAVADWCRSARPCLFDLDKDPCEQNNLAEQQPLLLKEMQARLAVYAATSILPREIARANLTHPDPRANPAYHNYSWMPWLKDDDISR